MYLYLDLFLFCIFFLFKSFDSKTLIRKKKQEHFIEFYFHFFVALYVLGLSGKKTILGQHFNY